MALWRVPVSNGGDVVVVCRNRDVTGANQIRLLLMLKLMGFGRPPALSREHQQQQGFGL